MVFEELIPIFSMIVFWGALFFVHLAVIAGLVTGLYQAPFSLKKALIFTVVLFVVNILLFIFLGFLIGFAFT